MSKILTPVGMSLLKLQTPNLKFLMKDLIFRTSKKNLTSSNPKQIRKWSLKTLMSKSSKSNPVEKKYLRNMTLKVINRMKSRNK